MISYDLLRFIDCCWHVSCRDYRTMATGACHVRLVNLLPLSFRDNFYFADCPALACPSSLLAVESMKTKSQHEGTLDMPDIWRKVTLLMMDRFLSHVIGERVTPCTEYYRVVSCCIMLYHVVSCTINTVHIMIRSCHRAWQLQYTQAAAGIPLQIEEQITRCFWVVMK